MDLLGRIGATISERVRPVEVVRAFGFTILLYACVIVVARLMSASFELESFAGRTISQATLDGVSIARRTGLYTSSIALFVGSVAALVGVFAFLRRWIDERARSLLQASSIGGLVLLYLAAYKSFPAVSLQLLFAFQLWVAVFSLSESRLEGRRLYDDHVAYLAWLTGASIAAWFLVLPVLPVERWPAPSAFAPVVGGLGVVLHIVVLAVRKIGSREGRARRVDACLQASLPLFFAPAAWVVSLELYMLANNARVEWLNDLGPVRLRLAFDALLLIWALVRYWRALASPRNAGERGGRGAYALGDRLAKVAFPVLLAGVLSFFWYTPLLEPSSDFMEPANPGLMIQQWLDFGRWPFFETFNAHGLSDALFGLIYAAMTGLRDETWQFYDHLYLVLASLVAYWILWKVTGSAYVAIFSVACLPYLEALFPDYCVHALVTVWVLRWILGRTSTLAWFAFFSYLAFGVVWRIDLGVATGAACVATLCAAQWMSTGSRLPVRSIVLGAVLSALAWASFAFALGIAKGVDMSVVLKDLANVLNSNQGFGFTRVAYRRNDVFIWHHFLIPLLMFLTGGFLMVRSRRSLDLRAAAWPCLALTFMTAYYFANFPRGLVRHTFLEEGNVYLSSFAFAVASLGVYAFARLGQALSFSVFVLVSSSFAYNFSLDRPSTKTAEERQNICERLAVRFRHPPSMVHAEGVIDRSPITAKFEEKHTGAILAFLEENLGPDETFLDLSNSPMLYVFSHRLAPHYLNHLLLAHNDYLQDRVLEDVLRHDVPIVLLKTEPSLSRRDGAADLSALDDVPFELRQYRLHEYVYEHYQPLCIVQRWHVWTRKNWMLPKRPPAEDAKIAWTLARPRALPEDEVVPEGQAAMFEVRGVRGRADQRVVRSSLALDPDLSYAIRITGASPRGGALHVEWGTRDPNGMRTETREIAWPAGAQDRYLRLSATSRERVLDRVLVDASGVADFALGALEVSELRGADGTAIEKILEGGRSDELRHLPMLWGSYDEFAKPFEIERLILGESSDAGREIETPIALKKLPLKDWRNGVSVERAGVLIDDAELAQTIRRGDRLVLAKSGERDVLEVEGRRVWLSGTPLDPSGDGVPNRAVWLRATRTSVVLRADTTAQYFFDSLGEATGGSYVVVRLKSLSPTTRGVYVDYGEDAETRGRFGFTTRNDGRERDYVIRTSTQYNWALRPKNWLVLAPQGGAVEVTRLCIARGD